MTTFQSFSKNTNKLKFAFHYNQGAHGLLLSIIIPKDEIETVHKQEELKLSTINNVQLKMCDYFIFLLFRDDL